MSTQKKVEITIKVFMNLDYDDDVDWSDPKKVILDQIDCEGIRTFLYDPLEMGAYKITKIKFHENLS